MVIARRWPLEVRPFFECGLPRPRRTKAAWVAAIRPRPAPGFVWGTPRRARHPSSRGPALIAALAALRMSPLKRGYTRPPRAHRDSSTSTPAPPRQQPPSSQPRRAQQQPPPEVSLSSAAAPSGKRSPGAGHEGAWWNAYREGQAFPVRELRRSATPLANGSGYDRKYRPTRTTERCPTCFSESELGLEYAGAVPRRGGAYGKGRSPREG